MAEWFKNLPFNSGDVGLIPGRGMKTPHASGQLNPRDDDRGPVPQLESVPHIERSCLL